MGWRFGVSVCITVIVMGFALQVGAEKKEEERKTILFLGDSLTAGYGLDEERAFPRVIQGKIDSLGMRFEVVNAGLSGETSSGGLRRVDWLLRRKVDVLVLALGANDALRGVPLKVTQKSLQGIVDKVKGKYEGVKVVIAGMEAPPNLGAEYTKEFREIFRDLAKKNGAVLVPFLLEDVAGIPALNLPDRIHPTEEGHKVVAENVWRVLGPVLKAF